MPNPFVADLHEGLIRDMHMPYVTEFVSFAVIPGKEARAREWLLMLQQRQQECVATLDREHMHFESIFQHEKDGRLFLSWLSVQGEAGASVNGSEHEIDRIHMSFWRECIDRSVEPIKLTHVVNFVAPSVQAAIADRARVLGEKAA